MNFPNALTLLRIFFVPLLVAAFVQGHVTIDLGFMRSRMRCWRSSLFLAAAFTDLLDGYLARRWGQITTVGTLLDPIADKLLVSSALIALVQVRVVPAWMTIVSSLASLRYPVCEASPPPKATSSRRVISARRNSYPRWRDQPADAEHAMARTTTAWRSPRCGPS